MSDPDRPWWRSYGSIALVLLALVLLAVLLLTYAVLTVVDQFNP